MQPSSFQRMAVSLNDSVGLRTFLIGLGSLSYVYLDMVRTGGGWVDRAVASALLLLGIRTCRNGFRRRNA